MPLSLSFPVLLMFLLPWTLFAFLTSLASLSYLNYSFTIVSSFFTVASEGNWLLNYLRHLSTWRFIADKLFLQSISWLQIGQTNSLFSLTSVRRYFLDSSAFGFFFRAKKFWRLFLFHSSIFIKWVHLIPSNLTFLCFITEISLSYTVFTKIYFSLQNPSKLKILSFFS